MKRFKIVVIRCVRQEIELLAPSRKEIAQSINSGVVTNEIELDPQVVNVKELE